MTCLNIVVVNQMINRTGAVKLKKYNFKYGLSYVWLNQCGELIIGSFIREVTAFLDDSPKCQFYKHMYSMHTLQYYLDRPGLGCTNLN